MIRTNHNQLHIYISALNRFARLYCRTWRNAFVIKRKQQLLWPIFHQSTLMYNKDKYYNQLPQSIAKSQALAICKQTLINYELKISAIFSKIHICRFFPVVFYSLYYFSFTSTFEGWKTVLVSQHCFMHAAILTK